MRICETDPYTGYDRASNRQWRQNTVAATGQDEYYTYDGLYQVKSLDRGTLNAGKTGINGTPSWEEDWNYDPLGNWNGASSAYQTKVTGAATLNQNRTHNVANEITNISTTTGTAWPTPVQNAVGNMTSIPQPLALGSSFELKWDAWNRQIEVTGAGSFIARYAYDGANRRVSKLTGKEFRHYYYSDQWQIIEERKGRNADADRRFFWGIRAIDDLICRDRGPLERLYVLQDAMSVTAVVDVNGVVQERYGYDGFGSVRYLDASFGSRSNSNYDWETLFDGYRYDQESGLYQVRYRYLHPKLGRWLSRDPIGEKGGLNLYRFVGNNPLVYLDPFGLFGPGYDADECEALLHEIENLERWLKEQPFDPVSLQEQINVRKKEYSDNCDDDDDGDGNQPKDVPVPVCPAPRKEPKKEPVLTPTLVPPLVPVLPRTTIPLPPGLPCFTCNVNVFKPFRPGDPITFDPWLLLPPQIIITQPQLIPYIPIAILPFVPLPALPFLGPISRILPILRPALP